ncbi:hypothetical protein KRP22_007554 [Phytophthora ramorum]|nr:hypothetical protein KRP22_4435 [Phytophthora ramorum]KAH7506473.1 hypothetical protein KRP22_4436 [Phytophthora ramorum]KAH7506474.1 hypothetical protein KRP22_4437 [Phytophthora ramorum]KAH7506475.1 hypothetical protein KRP22_4438 [Phytophthora ramorum]KAH7506476.1 hypothetical protein KRP22_4439 [Phytophthora ramorum]
MQENAAPSMPINQNEQTLAMPQQSPAGRFMGMSPAPGILPQQSTQSTPVGWVTSSIGPASSPLVPRNLQADLARVQTAWRSNEEGCDSSDDSDIDLPTTTVTDYTSWCADAIRKECTRRKLKVRSKMKKDERIAILKQHDDAQAAMDGIMLGDAGLTTGTNAVSKRTKHCPYRLINFLFSDEFATRYSQTGDTASRAALDSKQTNAKSNFWQEVRESYVHIFPKTHERNLVMFDDELFRGIDPSVTKPHPPEKLFAMAKELTQKYFAAEQRFTKCGQHENEFRNFVENQERGALSQRSQLLNILGDIRRHLGDIDKSIVAAANDDEAKDRLLEDRAVLLEERKSCIERLRTNTN